MNKNFFYCFIFSNFSVKFMPFPVHDAMLCMKTAPERTETIMRRIQDTLYRNVSPMKYSNGQAFRLQQVGLTQTIWVCRGGEWGCKSWVDTVTVWMLSLSDVVVLVSILYWFSCWIVLDTNSLAAISSLHQIILLPAAITLEGLGFTYQSFLLKFDLHSIQ